MVSLDALAFVRFGLRAPDDPRIVNTVKVIDATLKVDTPRGPAWHRYQGDGYGEHADGEPVRRNRHRSRVAAADRRARTLRARGRPNRRRRAACAGAWRRIAGESGLLPEQIWDSADIPERELFIGHASGSAMPLVWAHAEYLKLCRSLFDGRGLRSAASDRGAISASNRRRHDHVIWRFNNKVRDDAAGQNAPRRDACARRSCIGASDGWRTVHDTATRDTTLGVHVVDLATTHLRAGDRVDFTFYWPEEDRWEGHRFLGLRRMRQSPCEFSRACASH